MQIITFKITKWAFFFFFFTGEKSDDPIMQVIRKTMLNFVANGILSYIDNENQLYFQNFFLYLQVHYFNEMAC